jgi:uncharacterized protein YbjT (DUF2867 family)
MAMERVLVTGATGKQGGAAARRLLSEGYPVRFLTREPGGNSARRLIAAGAQAAKGDYEDRVSVRAALQGVTFVFAVQLPGPHERNHAALLVEEARRSGVLHYIQTSAAAVSRRAAFPRWDTGYWYDDYWRAKWDIEEMVRRAGFERFTVLRPAFLMENFLWPAVARMFPDLPRGELATAMGRDTVVDLISAEDVGAFAAAALRAPERFSGQSIDLAATAATIDQIGATLSKALGRQIRVVELSPEQAIARGQSRGWVRGQEWTNEVGYNVDIESATQYGVPLTSLSAWAAAHRDRFTFD